MEVDPQLVTIAGSVVIALGTIVGFIFKASWWLSNQFKDLRELTINWLQKHEDKDQTRHEDNLIRFAKIETKLDIVIKNGH